MIYFHAISIAIFCALAKSELPHPLSDEFINMINAKNTTWKAGRNFPKDTPMDYIKNLMGVIENNSLAKLPVMHHPAELIASLPDQFDPREKWPNCPSLNEIRDQGSCGSCWAFGAVEAMTDRVCIYSEGKTQFHFSAQDLTSCCDFCVSESGCSGGTARSAWQYWESNGIVSGGPFNSNQGCRPYEIPPCRHTSEGNEPFCNASTPTPQCSKTCEESYNVEYEKDRHFAKRVYSLDNEDDIKAELYNNGPVEASFMVYTDFAAYKTGVYQHQYGKRVGFHAIKMMGWGVENGVKYWLCANSWNEEFGDKGFFKILRGENHCNIEHDINAGEPQL